MYSQVPLEEQEWGEPERYLDDRFDPRVEPPLPPFLRSPRGFGVNDDHIAGDRRSSGWRILPILSWLFVPIVVGIGAGLAWQLHGAAARDMIVGQVQSLGSLLSTTKSPATAATAPDPMPQLEPLASNFELIRRNVEQLAAKQEQMAQNIALLQAVADDIREKMSTQPSSPSQQQEAAVPQYHAPQPKAPASAVPSASVPRSMATVGAALPSR
jgi:hypothetical protein